MGLDTNQCMFLKILSEGEKYLLQRVSGDTTMFKPKWGHCSCHIFKKGKVQFSLKKIHVLYFRCCTLSFLIKFNHVVVLINAVQTMLSFLSTTTELNLIGKHTIQHLRNYT